MKSLNSLHAMKTIILLFAMLTACAHAQTNYEGSINASGTITGNGSGLINVVGAIPSSFTSSFGRNKFIMREWASGSAVACDLVATPPILTGTGSGYIVPVSGIPGGVSYTVAAGGIYGLNQSTPREFWSTNAFTAAWSVSFTSDVSSNRIWCSLGTVGPATQDSPQTCTGFYGSNATWYAYSNDTTTTNRVSSGSIAINTLYTLVLRQVGTTNYYYINGNAVATNVWNPTATSLKHMWVGNALNAQAAGLTFYNYYIEYIP